jgi:dUTP pyrophosphatase
MKVRIKKLHEDARIPVYSTQGAACFDLFALIEPDSEINRVHLSKPVLFRTGLSVEVPDGHVMMIFSRSGHGFKNNIRLSNCVGIIDSDYRGEISVKLASDDPDNKPFRVDDGDRIAQALILPVERVEFIVSDELSDTARGEGGFGSTGA